MSQLRRNLLWEKLSYLADALDNIVRYKSTRREDYRANTVFAIDNILRIEDIERNSGDRLFQLISEHITNPRVAATLYDSLKAEGSGVVDAAYRLIDEIAKGNGLRRYSEFYSPSYRRLAEALRYFG